MMYDVSRRQANATAAAHIALSSIMAPLLTLSTSLQCSLPQNRVTMEHINPNLDNLSKVGIKAQVLKGETI